MSKIKTQTVMWLQAFRPEYENGTSEFLYRSVSDLEWTSKFYDEIGTRIVFFSDSPSQPVNPHAAGIMGYDVRGPIFVRKCEEEWLVAEVPLSFDERRVRHLGKPTTTKPRGDKIVRAETKTTKRMLCRDRAGYDQIMTLVAEMQMEVA